MFAKYLAGAVLCIAPHLAAAGEFNVLYRLPGGAGGGFPTTPLAFDSSGALYGLAIQGGAAGYGAAFQLVPSSATQWTPRTLASVPASIPAALNFGLAIDPATAHLFASTGFQDNAGSDVAGSVFEFSSPHPLDPSQPWSYRSLADFFNDTIGSPVGTLVFDHGRVIGAALGGDSSIGDYRGSAFALTPPSSATARWALTVLNSFSGPPGPYAPFYGPVLGPDGALYGETSAGGTHSCDNGFGGNIGCGTIYELTLTGSKAKASVLYNLQSYTQFFTLGTPVVGKDGAVYGVIGSNVFRLSAPTKPYAGRRMSFIYGFAAQDAPVPALTFDATGTHLYGVTNTFLFRLTPGAPGAPWTEETLHTFSDLNPAVDGPTGGLVLGPYGSFYGAVAGGSPGDKYGYVFAYRP